MWSECMSLKRKFPNSGADGQEAGTMPVAYV